MDKNNRNLKIILILIGLAIILGFTTSFIQSKSFLDLFLITAGIMVILVGIAIERGETPTYFALMFIVNILQWFILIYMLFINSTTANMVFVTLITLSIAPVMTIYLVHRIFITNLKSNGTNQGSGNYANFVDQIKLMLNNKAKVILIYVGIVIILGCLAGFSQSKSAEYLYGILIALLFIVYGNYHENNGTNITTSYIILMCIIISSQWLFLILFPFQFSGLDSVILGYTLTISISMYFVLQVAINDIKNLEKRRMEEERENNGYMVCTRCNRYYKLKSDDLPENFQKHCECGGKLKYKDMIWDQS
ncbi:hypothetical protein [Methanobacterium ferruginis]|uniref:hypothetical protein n=1 Tax=Methanobacterium ferruginis TaxID=710191 RepID=UPI002573C4F8|nr:hypothetical protein [Methanobacterium ferruginis]BDZ66913.1 hypothetical protein GCM10025860_03610 [Methanobacterium ferruginis]